MAWLRLAMRVLKVALLVLGALMVLATSTPLTAWMARQLMGPWQEPAGEVLVLLGAESPTNGFIGPSSYWRTNYAARAWREGGWQDVVICGGLGTSESMRELLILNGVPKERIHVETRSQSTRENALFALPLLEKLPGRKVLLTADFHTYRSVRVFRKLGVEMEARPIPYIQKRYNTVLDRWAVFLELLQELAKIGWYRINGWI